MQRVVVMGPPGSGKSTFARELGARHDLPVHHLDQAYWSPGWVEVPPAVFSAEVARVADLDAWVMDGNYVAAIASRLRRADTVIYLDIGSLVSIMRILKRLATRYSTVRPDSAPGCVERLDWSFLRFVWSWNRLRRESHLALVHGFCGRTLVLRTKADRRRALTGS